MLFGEIPLSSKIYNFLPVLPVYAIIVINFGSMFKFYIFDGIGVTFGKFICVPPFLFCSLMTCVCHSYSMFTDPGKVEPNLIPSEVSAHNDELFCKKCNKRRPIRTHHCKVCQRCILKMDHHCPWVANCVGYCNQKFFYQFLFYATLGDFIGFFCLLFRLFAANFEVPLTKQSNEGQMGILDIMWLMRDPIFLIIGTMTSLAMTISIGFLFFFQTSIIKSNLTTLENKKYKNNNENPFYYENSHHNMKIVLGMKSYIEWFIPVFTPNDFNNGHFYTTPREKESHTTKNYLVLGEDTEANKIDDH